jgi:hypothetical protein
VREDLGGHLHQALIGLEALSSTRSAQPHSFLALLVPPGAPLATRVNRVWRATE